MFLIINLICMRIDESNVMIVSAVQFRYCSMES